MQTLGVFVMVVGGLGILLFLSRPYLWLAHPTGERIDFQAEGARALAQGIRTRFNFRPSVGQFHPRK